MSTNGTHAQSLIEYANVWPVDGHGPTIASSELIVYLERDGEELQLASKPIVLESAWPLVVNGQLWLTLLCTPTKLRYFVLGFLFNEGLIRGLDDVLSLRIGEPPEEVIEVELCDRNLELPQHRTLTTGCGGGITFVDLAVRRQPVCSALRVTPEQVAWLMSRLLERVADEYREVGGFHTAALSHGHDLLVVASDIGRHNTLDKVAGECLVRGIPTSDAILLTTGRISTEMLGKAARMKVPVVVTRNSPTHLAVELARQWGITLVGYARGQRMHVYTAWERIEPALDHAVT